MPCLENRGFFHVQIMRNILLNLLFIGITLPFLLSLVWVGFALGVNYQKKKDNVGGLFACPKDIICIVPTNERQVLF